MNSGRCDRCRRRRCPARRRRTWRAPAPCPASPAATGTAEWPAGATASRNPAGANARDARRAGSGCRPAGGRELHRPFDAVDLLVLNSDNRRSAQSGAPQGMQGMCTCSSPAPGAGVSVAVVMPAAGSGRARRGVGGGRDFLLLLGALATLVVQHRRRRGTLPSEARCSSIRRRMPARCSSTTRTSSGRRTSGRPRPEAAQVALAVGLRDGDGLGRQQAQFVQALRHLLGQLHLALEDAQEFHHLRQVAGFLAVLEQRHALGAVDAGIGLVDAHRRRSASDVVPSTKG